MRLRFKILLIIFLGLAQNVFGAADELTVIPIQESTEIVPGSSGSIVLKVNIPDKSYIYGNPKGPGVGRATNIDISSPDNIIFQDPVLPPAKKYQAKGDPDYVWVYREHAEISLPFSTTENIKSGQYTVNIVITALLCTDRSCTLHDFSIDYPVRIVSKTGISNKKPISSFISGDMEEDNGFPDDKQGENFPAEDDFSFTPSFQSSVSISNIIQAVLFGILAGFILNFMPCVLPVISLKIMDIIRFSGQNRKVIRRMGLIFTSGIVTSFIILASLAAFLGYSWGGLFQKTAFLITMISIVYIFSLSMFEVFTINIPLFAGSASTSFNNKYLQTYAKGLLATLLATPCSGPFLGGALAWASTQSPGVVFIIFISVGIGMSLPYIILTANPKLVRFVPKPGPWMVTFENVMAFFLLGTAVYLLGILQESLIMPTVWFLLFLTIAFWQYGKYGSIVMPLKKRIISRIAGVLIILAGGFLSFKYFYVIEEEYISIESNKKQFSMDLLIANRNSGKISIVDFTADWCPNCKFVEKTSLYTEKVSLAMKAGNIDLLIADLTRENPEAKKLLTSLGSNSIPFLAVFPPGEPFYKPICLRDIYSERDVLNAIESALKK